MKYLSIARNITKWRYDFGSILMVEKNIGISFSSMTDSSKYFFNISKFKTNDFVQKGIFKFCSFDELLNAV